MIPRMTVAVQSHAADQFLPLEAHALRGDDECADEGLLAYIGGPLIGQQRHQVFAGYAPRRSTGAGVLGDVESSLHVHVVPEEGILHVGVSEAVEVREEAFAHLQWDPFVTFLGALT